MNTHTDHEAMDALRAARPEPPTELVSPDSQRAQQLVRSILAEDRHPGRDRRPRPRLIMALSAAAAAAAIGVLIALPDTDDPPASGSGETAPPTTPTDSPAVATPVIDPTGPQTATATMNVNGTLEQLTLEGGDVSTRLWAPAEAGRGLWIENRVVDGVLYVNFGDGWTYDSNDYTTLSNHPNGSTPFELYPILAEQYEFTDGEPDEIDGIAVTRISAADPSSIDAQLLPLGGASGEVQSLDLWVTDGGVVLRMDVEIVDAFGAPIMVDATEVEAFPDSVPVGTFIDDTISAGATMVIVDTVPVDGALNSIVLEFHDVGNPAIVLEAPEDATELDAVDFR